MQTASEREAEARSAQELASRLQGELTRSRQELQEKTSQEDRLRQQLGEKEERTKKAILMAKQKISQVTGKNPDMKWTAVLFFCGPLHLTSLSRSKESAPD